MRLPSYVHRVIDYFDPERGPEDEFFCRCGFAGNGKQMDGHIDHASCNDWREAMESKVSITRAGD